MERNCLFLCFYPCLLAQKCQLDRSTFRNVTIAFKLVVNSIGCLNKTPREGEGFPWNSSCATGILFAKYCKLCRELLPLFSPPCLQPYKVLYFWCISEHGHILYCPCCPHFTWSSHQHFNFDTLIYILLAPLSFLYLSVYFYTYGLIKFSLFWYSFAVFIPLDPNFVLAPYCSLFQYKILNLVTTCLISLFKILFQTFFWLFIWFFLFVCLKSYHIFHTKLKYIRLLNIRSYKHRFLS